MKTERKCPLTEPEPDIVVNGVALSEAQAMTVRVALESFSSHLDDGLGNDRHGQIMVLLYRSRLKEIRKALYSHLGKR